MEEAEAEEEEAEVLEAEAEEEAEEGGEEDELPPINAGVGICPFADIVYFLCSIVLYLMI